MTTLIVICTAVLLSASWLADVVLALHLREAKRALIWRNIEKTELVKQLNEAIERARTSERVLEDWAKKDGREPAVLLPKKREVLS